MPRFTVLRSSRRWKDERLSLRRIVNAGLFGLAVLLGLAYLPGRCGPQFDSAASLFHGEALLNGLEDPRISYQMPLASVTAAFLGRLPPWSRPLPGPALGVLALVLVFSLGRLLHSAAWGLAAVLLVLPGFDTNDILLTVLFLLLANVLAWRARSPGVWRGILTGAAIGLSLLCKSSLFLLPLVLVSYESLSAAARRKPVPWKAGLPLLLAPCLMLSGWVHMNWKAHGRFLPFENGRADINIITSVAGAVNTVEGDARGLAAIGPEENLLAWAFREIAREPGRYAAAVPARLWFIFKLHPVLFLLAGLALWRHRRREDYRQLGLLAFYYILVHSLLSVEERYMAPTWPLLAVMAAGAPARGFGAVERPLPSRPPMGPVWAILAPALACGLATMALVATYPARLAAGHDLAAAIRAHPDSPALWSESGRRRMRAGDPQGAARDYARAVRLLPSSENVFDYAWALLARGGPAQDLVDRVPVPASRRYEALPARLGLAKSFRSFRRGDRKSAARDAGQAYQHWYSNVSFARGHGTEDRALQARLKGNDSRFVREVAEFLMPFPPKERLTYLNWLDGRTPGAGLRFLIAEAALASGDRRELLRALVSIRSRSPDGRGSADPDQTKLLTEIAAHARTARDQPLARELSAVAEKLIVGPQERAYLYQTLGEYQKASVILDRLVQDEPREPRHWSDRGVLKVVAGRRDEAVADLEQALRLDPAFLPAVVTLGGVYFGQGRPELAAVLYDRILVRKPRPGDRALWERIRADRSAFLERR